MSEAHAYSWEPGQRVFIDRRESATIDTVDTTGNAHVGSRTFGPDGIQKRVRTREKSILEPRTSCLAREVDRIRREELAFDHLRWVLLEMVDWLAMTFGPRRKDFPTEEELSKGERAAVAVMRIMRYK